MNAVPLGRAKLLTWDDLRSAGHGLKTDHEGCIGAQGLELVWKKKHKDKAPGRPAQTFHPVCIHPPSAGFNYWGLWGLIVGAIKCANNDQRSALNIKSHQLTQSIGMDSNNLPWIAWIANADSPACG